jgi:hypothetical protein
MNIKAGAYNGSFELSKLSLEKLALSAGRTYLADMFSTPNNVEMSSFYLLWQ